jgi:hypothetical protein
VEILQLPLSRRFPLASSARLNALLQLTNSQVGVDITPTSYSPRHRQNNV